MKKWIVISILFVAVLSVAAFAWSGTVFARNLYNNYGPYGHGMMGGYGYGQGMMDGYGYGHGMMRGYGYDHGMMGDYGYGRGRMGSYGFGMMGGSYDSAMHEYMIEELANALDLTREEITDRIQAGETPWQIALAEGLTEEQIQQVMQESHDQALQAAVEAGELTQEQADWMDQHMESMWSGTYRDFGSCHGSEGG